MTEKYLELPTAIWPTAPSTDEITPDDRANMLTYVRLIDADRDGHSWQAAARDILSLDVEPDPEEAERCWRTHLERARWVTGEGLAASLGSHGVDWEPGEDR